jgi:hypothetical protein
MGTPLVFDAWEPTSSLINRTDVDGRFADVTSQTS